MKYKPGWPASTPIREVDYPRRMTTSTTTSDSKPDIEIELARGEEVIAVAEFDANSIIRYHYFGLIPLCIFIVTIPLALLIALGYRIWLNRVVASWSAVLTNRSLHVRKGIWNKTEKTIPLEKITDLSSIEGLVMRWAGIKRLGIETAGQSGPGALVSLLGVVDSDAFRGLVLDQRDRSNKSGSVEGAGTKHLEPSVSSDSTLLEIQGTLASMAADLKRVADRLDDASP